MTRKCSHCSNNGHNSRTCQTRTPTNTTTTTSGGSSTVCGGGVRLFGVRLTYVSSMKKSASMGNLSHTSDNNITTSPNSERFFDVAPAPVGYLSDDANRSSCSSGRRGVCERKKGKPWTEGEHRLFLLGLQKLGKGDWRGIARSYVMSRTPTQVASHAQKYFIRQSNASCRKRRLSLFDMVPDMVTEEPQSVSEEQLLPPHPAKPRETDYIKPNLNPNLNSNPNPDLNLSTTPNPNPISSLDISLYTEPEPMEATPTEEVKETQDTTPGNMALPTPPIFLPLPYKQFWPIHPETEIKPEISHRVLKPTPVLRKEPVNVDELVSMSRLNLSGTDLSLNLLSAPSRQSAFHASAPGTTSNSELNEGNCSVIQAA